MTGTTAVRPVLLVAGTSEVLAALGHLGLAPEEEARAARMLRREDRDDFRAAHLLARRALALATGTPEGTLVPVQRCAGCGAAHGRPGVPDRPDVHVAWSHTRGAVAAVAADVPCGTDVERTDGPPRPERVVARSLTADELPHVRSSSRPHLAFIEAWAVKESLVKAGTGDLAVQLGRTVVGPEGLATPGQHDRTDARIRVVTGPGTALEAVVRIDHEPGLSVGAVLVGGGAAPVRLGLTTA